MSLFGSLQLAGNALSAAQLGLQVTGNNIANAGTPGYLRQELVVTPAPTQQQGGVLLGQGVEVVGVVQKVDHFLEGRLRSANSDAASGQTKESTYRELELLLGELSDTDLSTSLTNFFGGVQEILNQPESAAVRNLSVLEGEKLANDIARLYGRAQDLQGNLNERVASSSADINQLLEKVAQLNVKIVSLEGGVRSDAVGLRDQRQQALGQLSQIIPIDAVEQADGQVTVLSGGDYLVQNAEVRKVETVVREQNGIQAARVQIVDTGKQIDLSSGELGGLVDSRDTIVGDFLSQLDGFARQLISTFNEAFSSGQGLTGYSETTSEFAVDDPAAPLHQAGLPFTPRHGSFSVLVTNSQTGATTTHDVAIDLDGLGEETSLADLASTLDGIEGIQAHITPGRKLAISSESPEVQFAFDDDTSGVLAALGVNHFFSGSGAADIGVAGAIKKDPALFAASGNGIGADASNAERLAGLLNQSSASANGLSLAGAYERLASNTTQGSAVARSVAQGQQVFQQSLEAQHLSVSGVNLDEETVKMLAYQRAFQATAKYISTVNELLETLINL